MKCKICGNQNNNTKYIVKDNMFGSKVTFDYFQCNSCQCLQINHPPENISEYYPVNYYSYNQSSNYTNNNTLKNYLIKKRNSYKVFHKGIIGKVLNILWRAPIFIDIIGKLGLTKEAAILDVGSGNGNKLVPLIGLGMNIKGIDPLIKESLNNNGLTIDKKTLLELQDKYDMIMFNHVFEHLSNPLEILEKTNSLLNIKGICLLRIPIVSSYAWELYGVNWVALDAPRHFFLHSLKSIEILVNKANFKIKDILYDSTEFQFMGSELYKRGISFVEGDFSLKSNRYFTNREIRAFKHLSKELNIQKIGDQAAFILVKD